MEELEKVIGPLGTTGTWADTCFDYVDSLIQDGDRYGVTIFVEPGGNITKWGDSWEEVIEWWIEVFISQPPGIDYARCGWHLYEQIEDGGELPENPYDAWKGIEP